MKIIRPISITDAVLDTTNVAETVSVYSTTATYGLGVQARTDTNHRLFESQQASNTNHPVTDTAWWVDVGPTNRWAMFDDKNGTQTSNTSSIDVTLTPTGRADSLALLNIDAASAQVVVNDGSSDIYDQTFPLVSTDGITDWHAYFFEEIVRKNKLFLDDLPIISSPNINVVLSDTGATVKCGSCVIGRVKSLGGTQYGAGVGIVDYSKKTADDFGNYTITERAFSAKARFDVYMDNNEIDEMNRLLSLYRATPLVWIGAEEYTLTIIFGFFRDFNINIAYPLNSLCSLEIEGLT